MRKEVVDGGFMRFITVAFAMVVLAVVSACGSKVPKCSDSKVEAALQDLFRNKTAAIFSRYVWPNPDVPFLMRVTAKLKMGLLPDNVTIYFPPGEAEKIKWTFKTTGIASSNPDAAVCTSHATYSRDDLSEGFDFNFEARKTDEGGAFIKLTD